MRLFYDRGKTFSDPPGVEGEELLRDVANRPNVDADFSQVRPEPLYKKFCEMKGAITHPASNWIRSGQNGLQFGSFCADRPYIYLFLIFKSHATLNADGRFDLILPGWFTREMPGQFHQSGGLPPGLDDPASGQRGSARRSAGLPRAELAGQADGRRERGGRGGRRGRGAAHSFSGGGGQPFDEGAYVLADAMRSSFAPPPRDAMGDAKVRAATSPCSAVLTCTARGELTMLRVHSACTSACTAHVLCTSRRPPAPRRSPLA
jgi:hypothetical protein